MHRRAGRRARIGQEESTAARSAAAAALPEQDLRERLLYTQALESVRCLEEGVIEAAPDASIGSILGIGFPLRDRKAET